MNRTRYEKLMAVANDPNATPEERESYRKMAEKIQLLPKKQRTVLELLAEGIYGGEEFKAAMDMMFKEARAATKKKHPAKRKRKK